MTAPFATAYPPLLQAAVQAMDAVLSTGWPRIAFHRGEVLEGLIICWCNIQEAEILPKDLELVKDRIKSTVKIVTAILKKCVDVEEEYRVLIDSESRLRDLLII